MMQLMPSFQILQPFGRMSRKEHISPIISFITHIFQKIQTNFNDRISLTIWTQSRIYHSYHICTHCIGIFMEFNPFFRIQVTAKGFEFSIYSFDESNVVILMKSIASTISTRTGIRNLVPLQHLETAASKGDTLILEIGKDPNSWFRNSLWVGYRNGGMASWLAALMPHLPHQQFCLYMDEHSYQESEYMYSYYSEYFSKLFHSQYIGTCIHPRPLVPQKLLKTIQQVKANQLQTQLQSSPDIHTVLLDLRNYDAVAKDCLTKETKKFDNTSYLNISLNDQDLPEILMEKMGNLPDRVKLVTLCGKGYRSTIGYSLLELMKKNQWEVKLCRSTFDDIKRELVKPVTEKQVRSSLI